MPRRCAMRGPAALLLAVTALSACGADGLPVDEEGLAPGAAGACRSFVRSLPDRVDGLGRAETLAGGRVTAYGSPAQVVVRCGVPAPRGLSRTSACQSVNGLDWYVPVATVEDQSRDVVATSIARAPRVRLVVAAERRPPVAALVDVGVAVREGTRATGRGCL